MKKIAKVAGIYEATLVKEAAKERASRKQVDKMLGKAKSEYAKYKGQLDLLEAEDAKRKAQLDVTRRQTNDLRQKVMKMHKAMQCMDLANASDAVFYNDDSSDIGYIISGKEFHLEIDENGEMSLHPMRKFRSERKSSKKDENCAEDCMDASHGHPVAEDESLAKDEDFNVTDEDLDDLYASLLE